MAIFISGILYITGCVVPMPGTTETSPEIGGRVVDAHTKEPVVRAKVQIQNRPDTTAISDSTGHFHLAAARELYLMRLDTPSSTYPLPPTRKTSYKLFVTHPNYEPAQIDTFEQWQDWLGTNAPTPPGAIVIRDIELNPKKK